MNGNVTAYAGAEPNRIVGVPVYKSGHGWSSDAGGNYQLEVGSPGRDKGVRLNNFNDGYTGSAPDVGAHEADTGAMKFGVNGAGATWITPVGGGASTPAPPPRAPRAARPAARPRAPAACARRLPA